ncbi:hypothetical protein [uncultured Legionella sp.]|uniref:hypothetical protein n=1 Tax=uncultured Legionella sp. TaxID=210934 RepID=UPI0026299446|nr:hypothetical protein [uncultured Legionella sp.]
MINRKRNALSIMVFIFGVLSSTASEAWHGGGPGPIHRHGEDIRVYNPGGYGYGRGYYYGGGPIIVPNIVPNVIINVPPPRYYRPICEEVEVCDSYGECWLDQYCN